MLGNLYLSIKTPHASGGNLDFPSMEEIANTMSDFESDYFVDVFGDGSVTTPTKWWAALAGHGMWVPDWNKPGEVKVERSETSYHAAGLGQISSSTRQELAAWVRTLALPIRSRYATDSASMMDKAIQMMKAAAKYEEQDKSQRFRNPFKKPWGMQTDGDLWEQAWTALLARGTGNQQIRKVKGHATEEMVLNGTVKKEDKIGNDKSDENADLGVLSIHGVGLLKLAKWLAQRHDKYGKLMKRIRKFIAGMTLAEKEEREKEKVVNKSVLGYDPETMVKTKVQIKYEDLAEDAYEKLKLPPVVKGKHKYAYCQNLYEDVHTFLQHRTWSHTRPETACSGITWTELFVVFDTAGYRPRDAVHVKDKEAVNRATIRRKAAREAHAKKAGKELKHGKAGIYDVTQSTVTSKPPLEQELALFKAIVRQIGQHELGEEQKKMFRMESRAKLRRLAPLGIVGNQPAIAAFCKIDELEKKITTEAILQQKIGANRRTHKAQNEFKERIEKSKEEGTYQDNANDSTMLVKFASIANGTVVRWTRNVKDSTKDEVRSEEKAKRNCRRRASQLQHEAPKLYQM